MNTSDFALRSSRLSSEVGPLDDPAISHKHKLKFYTVYTLQNSAKKVIKQYRKTTKKGGIMIDEIPLVAVQEIIGLDGLGLLFIAPSKDEYEKVALSDEGAEIICLAVEFCIQSGKTPNCAINGDDLTVSHEITSLNQLELKDLIRKLNLIHSLEAKTFDPSRN